MSNDPVRDAAEAFLACLCEELASRPSPPGICCLRVGDVVVQDVGVLLDECCEGQSFVRVAGIYPSSTDFPGPDTGAVSPCGFHAWAVALEAGVFRCNPSGDASNPATCDQWTEAATQAFSDSQALRQAACCIEAQITESFGSGSVSVGQIVPAGPDGDCLGQTLVVTIQVNSDCNC